MEDAAQPEDKAQYYSLVRHLINDLALLFRKELALAGSEVSETLEDTGQALASLLSGVVVLNSGCLFLLTAVTMGLGQIMELWLAATLVGGLVTVTGLIMVMAGRKKLGSSSLKPSRTMDSIQKDKATVKEHVL